MVSSYTQKFIFYIYFLSLAFIGNLFTLQQGKYVSRNRFSDDDNSAADIFKNIFLWYEFIYTESNELSFSL